MQDNFDCTLHHTPADSNSTEKYSSIFLIESTYHNNILVFT